MPRRLPGADALALPEASCHKRRDGTASLRRSRTTASIGRCERATSPYWERRRRQCCSTAESCWRCSSIRTGDRWEFGHLGRLVRPPSRRTRPLVAPPGSEIVTPLPYFLATVASTVSCRRPERQLPCHPRGCTVSRAFRCPHADATGVRRMPPDDVFATPAPGTDLVLVGGPHSRPIIRIAGVSHFRATAPRATISLVRRFN